MISFAFLLLLFTVAASESSNKIKFIKKFVDSQDSPTNLIVWKNCFSDSQKFSLLKNSSTWTMFSQGESLDFLNFRRNPNHELLVMDLTCFEDMDKIIQKIDTRLFGHPYRWLIYYEEEKSLKGIRALPDSNIVIVDQNYDLQQFYKIEEKSTQIFYENYGSWIQATGEINKTNLPAISKRRSDLQGKELTVSYVALNNDSFNHLEDFVDTSIDTLVKANYPLMRTLSKYLNCTHKEIHRNTWGYIDPKTKTYPGMMGDLINQRADISGTPLIMTSERYLLVDYVPFYTTVLTSFIFRPPQMSTVSNIFTLPFQLKVWIACIVLALIGSGILYMIKQIENTGGSDLTGNDDRFSDSMLVAVAAVCQMDASLKSKLFSTRMILFLTFLTFSFLYAAYTANIVSLLQSPSKNIRNLEDLYKSKIEMGIEDTPYFRFFYSTYNDPFYRKIYLEKLAPPDEKDHFVTAVEGIKRIREGRYGFMMEESRAYRMIEDTFFEHEKCDLQNIAMIRITDPFTAITKGSPYKEILRRSFVKIMETGIQKRILTRTFTKKPVCSQRQTFQSISIEDALPAFLITITGCGLAFIFLLVEKIAHHYQFNFWINKI